jgi:ParB-like chromosome segregation protein Spo0J
MNAAAGRLGSRAAPPLNLDERIVPVSDKSFYLEVLGLGPQASEADVKRAYRELARQCHPDKNPGDAHAAARFKTAQAAYDLLTGKRQPESENLADMVDDVFRDIYRSTTALPREGYAFESPANYPTHRAARLFPLMGADELAALAEDIRQHGQRDPITLYRAEVLDGRNRKKACERAGVTPRYVLLTHLPDGCSPTDYVLSRNLHRRHLTPEQRRGVIAAVLKEDPKKSNRRVADQVQVDDKTVASVRRELEATAEIPQSDRTRGKDGRERPARKAKAPPQAAPPDAAGKADAETKNRAGREDGQQGGEIKPLGVGVLRGHEAIDCLSRIPKNDALRERGFQIVTDWIKRNR